MENSSRNIAISLRMIELETLFFHNDLVKDSNVIKSPHVNAIFNEPMNYMVSRTRKRINIHVKPLELANCLYTGNLTEVASLRDELYTDILTRKNISLYIPFNNKKAYYRINNYPYRSLLTYLDELKYIVTSPWTIENKPNLKSCLLTVLVYNLNQITLTELKWILSNLNISVSEMQDVVTDRMKRCIIEYEEIIDKDTQKYLKYESATERYSVYEDILKLLSECNNTSLEVYNCKNLREWFISDMELMYSDRIRGVVMSQYIKNK